MEEVREEEAREEEVEEEVREEEVKKEEVVEETDSVTLDPDSYEVRAAARRTQREKRCVYVCACVRA